MRRKESERAFDEYWYYIWRMMAMAEDKFKNYHRVQVSEMRPYEVGEDMSNIRMSGIPKEGDMIARNPKNRDDLWLVKKEDFENQFEFMEVARGQQKRQEF